MNVFDFIRENNTDSLDRTFVLLETELDITVERAIKDFLFESALISEINADIFTEASGDKTVKDEKSENVFVKTIKTICDGVRNFIKGVLDALSSLFDPRDNIDPEKYFKDPNKEIHFDKDMKKLNKVVDDQTNNGKSLLQKIGSAVGVSDDEVDKYVNDSNNAIKAIAGCSIPAVVAFTINKLFGGFIGNKNKAISDAENIASGSGDSDPKKNKQKIKVITHMSNMVKTFTNYVKGYSVKLESEKDPDYEKELDKIKQGYADVDKKYKAGEIDDDEMLQANRDLKARHNRATEKHTQKVMEEQRRKAEEKKAKKLRENSIDYVNRMTYKGKIDRGANKTIISYIDNKYNKYMENKLSYTDYVAALNKDNLTT